MSNKQRQDLILDLLEKQGYVTVKYLTELLHYSSATINRDLNALEGRGLVVRSYGGVEPVRARYVPVLFRSHRMHVEKNRIGKAAAELVKDGDTIFIDGSTTAQCMGQYLVGRKNLTVVTNNMALATSLGEYEIRVICLGGTVVEAPSMLGGHVTAENAAKYKVDKMFFSTEAVTSEGQIATGLYDMVFRALMKNGCQRFYLVDHKKIDLPVHQMLCTFEEIDSVISDHTFPEATQARYPNTRFVTVSDQESK